MARREKIEDGFFVQADGSSSGEMWGPFVLQEQAEECVIALAARIDVSGAGIEYVYPEEEKQ